VPTYTYTCTACNAHVEKRQSFSDPPLTTCEECGGTLRKIIHPVGIVFKGSGWYVNDSRSARASTNGPSKASESDSASADKDSSTKDSGAKESSGAKDTSSAKESSSAKEPSASTATPKTTGSSADKS